MVGKCHQRLGILKLNEIIDEKEFTYSNYVNDYSIWIKRPPSLKKNNCKIEFHLKSHDFSRLF